MDLILWRHAQAQALREGQDDLDRALTPKGERQAQRMADWLNHRLASRTRILVSPTLRTQATAQALGRKFKTVAAVAPDISALGLLDAARWPDAPEPVLIVGHQPAMGQLAALLLSGVAQEWVIKKGAVWWLRGRQRDGSVQVFLQAMQSPDCL